MSYPTMEVELHDGRVIPTGTDVLPKSATGLLIILSEIDQTTEPAKGWEKALTEIRARQKARSHVPRTVEDVNAQIEEERSSWD